MNKILFFGDLKSKYLVNIIDKYISQENELITSIDCYNMLDSYKDNKRIKTWSWHDLKADYCIKNELISLLPYLYPNTIDFEKLNKIIKIKLYSHKTYSDFRLGFGVQEEIFDLFLANLFEVQEIVYYDLLTSLQLLNPITQFEYRKRNFEYLKFTHLERFSIMKQSFKIKNYNIIYPIPFFELFSGRFGGVKSISHILTN